MRIEKLFMCCALLFACATCVSVGEEKYIPSWEVLAAHTEAPDWFRDAKFGIYSHWGVYSVPEFSTEWYPRLMYRGGRGCREHHLATYGEDFHYHDFIPQFTAGKFDAEEWADLYVRAGARFAGPVAEHHDGFAMWDSEHTPFNAADMGPKRDIVGELEKAIRKRNLRFMMSFHHSHNPSFYTAKNKPPMNQPEYAKLYGSLPREDFLDMWYGKLKESIDNYQPDLMWFDYGLGSIPHERLREYFGYYFKNHKEGVVTLKNKKWKGVTIQQLRQFGVEDFEKGRLDHLTDYAWLTDDTITDGSWSFTRQMKLKPREYVLHVLIDIVSKNGQLLLNIAPRADGSIPEDQREILYFVGDWLKTYGESIYGTRPFVDFGEGPTRLKKAGHFVKVLTFTSNDVRYTTKGNTVYAILLGRPEPGAQVSLACFGAEGKAEGLTIRKISMLGAAQKVDWKQTPAGLILTVPEDVPTEAVVVYKIDTEGLQALLVGDTGLVSENQ